MKPEHFKEFNAEHAKAGAPYCQRNGLAARIGIWDSVSNYPLVGVRSIEDAKEQSAIWDKFGQILLPTSFSEECCLVMLPLGYCEGKPVFVGDELVTLETSYTATIGMTKFNASKWPRKEPVMPEFSTYTDEQEIISVCLERNRSEIEAYWKELDEYNGVKA